MAIDDVGTGRGGLSYMLKVRANTIKIDKLFVDATGTENFEQVMKLRDFGIGSTGTRVLSAAARPVIRAIGRGDRAAAKHGRAVGAAPPPLPTVAAA